MARQGLEDARLIEADYKAEEWRRHMQQRQGVFLTREQAAPATMAQAQHDNAKASAGAQSAPSTPPPPPPFSKRRRVAFPEHRMEFEGNKRWVQQGRWNEWEVEGPLKK